MHLTYLNKMKVRIKNYQAIKKAELEFTPGVTVIVGNSNNGKSSIIRSIEAAINNKGGSSFINYDADNCQVNIEDNGQSIIWHKNRSSAKSFYQLNDRTLNKIGQKQLEEVGQLLNMPEVVVNNEKFRLNFWKQLDYPFLVGSTHYQLFEFISKSKDQELIANLLDETTTEIKDLNAELNDFNAQINVRTKDITEVEAEIKALEVFEAFDVVHFSRLNKLKNETENLIEKYIEAEKETGTLQCKIKNIEDKINKIALLANNIENQLLLFNSLESYIKVFKKESTLITEINKKTNKIKHVTETLDVYKQVKNQMIDVENNIKMYNSAYEKETTLNQKLSNVKKEIKTYQFELDQFEVCPFCHNSIKDHGGISHDK